MSNGQQIPYTILAHPDDRFLVHHLQRVTNNSVKTIEEILNRVHTTIPKKDILETIRVIAATHDILKATVYFQQYLPPISRDTGILKSHAIFSSLYAAWNIQNNPVITNENKRYMAYAAAFVVAGHHSCIRNKIKYLKSLDQYEAENIFTKQAESLIPNQEEMEYITTKDLKLGSFKEFFFSKWQVFLPGFSSNTVLLQRFNAGLEPFFIINMLFSALIDNDNLDAAELDRPSRAELDYDAIRNYVKKFEVKTFMDKKRMELFDYIDNLNPNIIQKIFTFTAKTGLGKTLTSMNLALNLRKKIQQEKGYTPKIIYVAPFISILDQTLETIQKAFNIKNGSNSNLLSIHHHLANTKYLKDKEEGYTSNQSEFLTHGWNSEIILTTFIQFFSMIFGRWTSQLRRFDNIMSSIVILDEVQSIPFSLWNVVREAMLFLANKFNFTFIFMTATQPIIFKDGEAVELADNKIELPQRVTFVPRNEQEITLSDFCSEMNKLIANNYHNNKNIMIELNTIYTAKEVFDHIHSDTHDIRFLSSQVIPKHRRPRINKVKQQIKSKVKSIILVTTQVVEAGVDIDFDISIRDIGPIDSIVQAAGRCNREFDREAKESLFYVYRIIDDRRDFKIEHAKYVYGPVSIEIANHMLQPGTEDLVREYYLEAKRRLSMERGDNILQYISELDYESMEKEFNILDEGMYKQPIFIEFDDQATEIWKKYLALSQVDNKKQRRKSTEAIQLRNEMGQYIINVNDREIEKLGLLHAGGIFKIDRDRIGELYHEEKGFSSSHGLN